MSPQRARSYLALFMVPLALAGLASGAGAQNREDPVSTVAGQVTANPNPVRAHSSPQIARNPETGELVIAETDVFGNPDFGVKVHVSSDEGRSWAAAETP